MPTRGRGCPARTSGRAPEPTPSYPWEAVPPSPPPKPTSPRPAPAPATPSGSLSAGLKEQLTVQALGLLNEQVQARIVHYKAELETNAELDAITAQVVAQLKAMQASAAEEPARRRELAELQAEQTRTLSRLLERCFGAGESSGFATSNLKSVGRRMAKLFFESELHEKTNGNKDKTIHFPEQGVFYVLQRYKNRLHAELEGFSYANDELKRATAALLSKTEKDLQVAFLSRRSPELNRVMNIYTSVLLRFLTLHLPPHLGELSGAVVRAAQTASQPNSVGYKIHSESFAAFRREWEQGFMRLLVGYCGDQLPAQLAAGDQELREDTIKFFTDPHIFSETAQVLCDSVYDFLCLEGFLDLPMDWRVSLARS